MTSRELALNVLQNVENGKKSGTSLHELLNNTSLERPDRALATELVNGVLRRRLTLDAVISACYHHRYDKIAPALKNILRIGTYQLLWLNRIPKWAAVSESVNLARKYKGDRMAQLVNALLRKIDPDKTLHEVLLKETQEIRRLAITFSHPEWLIERWSAIYGLDKTIAMLEYNNRTPLTGFRINTLKTTFQEFVSTHGMNESINTITGLDNFFLAEDFSRFEPFIKKGFLTVQNPTQSLACRLCNPSPGSNVIDLCAAPGGKSTFLGELMRNSGSITSVDLYSKKLEKLTAHATELGISIISTVASDARNFVPASMPDIILLDAPCSGSGVLARRAELRWKLSLAMLTELITLQAGLLEHAASLLGADGVLVYATCSIEAEENQNQIDAFLRNHPEFARDPQNGTLPEPFAGSASENGSILMLPGELSGFDGGFVQRLKKTSH
ncbi:MAG: 16S rRNA (cytosine(967)-C(5))-methyltransferase [Chlorobium sp.]|jgi:16S rRNA (cytosine967-C5)-methyltransferase|uniref:16S rRNA (cytosine(967)-C(5))-methyltransferase RsmB n=1 Tax=Chlorobium sp. TaxID=1095 RepID=UPI001D32EDD7|nr:16S rRNA (cytosine(967)-C(5))-methyltransferase RsmB [Chlorobium sp.]MBN1278568.1 16S rRNA (cytosine(967)-C(5))-methyltransferase [Chlorobiaceae bacterium]MCF8215931.1 16S rRNA (cytosine(967)-C(5))-methyltransferase [Chlorobium sp.]MCF8270829.1 16S rRNA (cytosine(967)-C(5))-methyltransferase [Chlorobium sp.]MCF8287141.1 16S rRNA (cytosine(967)-C(5))-methyltransferase [Chlorobium sp.]MCF8290798.1 16S rRNA (cytosine(967)-C(5))-methyltransferase [Chlorobium sp.]